MHCRCKKKLAKYFAFTESKIQLLITDMIKGGEKVCLAVSKTHRGPVDPIKVTDHHLWEKRTGKEQYLGLS